MKLPRTIPTAVRRALRAEVGFGCPVDGCEVPYLEYHHFDPPWHVENHHRPEGMIALCSVHHAKADAWTKDQIRELKIKSLDGARQIGDRFEWMRSQVLAIVGGNYYLECPVILELNGTPAIWYNRDESNHALLNVRLPTTHGNWSRFLDHNDWNIEGQPVDVVAPPSGNELSIQYEDGFKLRVKFREWKSAESFFSSHEAARGIHGDLSFPLLTAELNLTIPKWGIRLRPKASEFDGLTMRGCVMVNCGIGVSMTGGPTLSNIVGSYSDLLTD